jgi:hypothetical protein
VDDEAISWVRDFNEVCVLDSFTLEVVAFVIVWFFVLTPLVIKLRTCLEKYQVPSEIAKDSELGIMTASVSLSTSTLRVPENGGVE